MRATLALLASGAFAPASQAQEAARGAVRADGLLCSFESRVDGSKDARLTDRVALEVGDDEVPSDLLPAGPFHATWRGVLELDLRSKLRFCARGTGRAKLSIGGQVVFDGELRAAAELASADARHPQGANELDFEYDAPAKGAATVRLLWSGRDFDWEPIPPAVLRHDRSLEPAELLARRRGREVVAERRCLRCHAMEKAAADAIARVGMLELTAAAPDLSDAGSRLNRDWIAHWIVAPRSLRPTARMPRLLGEGDLEKHLAAGDARALDLAAYLSSRHRQEGAPPSVAVDPAQAEAGGRLFAQLGCIGCHVRPDREAEPGGEPDGRAPRIPLRRVAWKWQPAALVRFLKKPTADDPWIRMPDLHLEDAEATALASFLLTRSPANPANSAPPTPAGGDARRGEELYAQLECRRCHEPEAARAALPSSAAPNWAAASKADWSARGCAAEPAKRAAACPDLELDEGDRAALRSLGTPGLASLERRNAADFALREVRELQCNACHTIGVSRDRWQGLVAETQDLLAGVEPPTLEQARPALTFIGEKLHTDWMARLIAGEIPERTRPWLLARMPAFPARAQLLARGLAERDGFAASAAQPEAGDAALREIGRKLLFEGGFSCVSCHDVGPKKALSRFEFGTPDLALEHARIRPDYFRRWLMNPLRVEPSSKMPRYVDDEGRSPFREFLDGDIRRQFEAIRLFLAGPLGEQR
jgi:cbb3-type cytochrome oxidase cytochrome c subunit